MSNPIVPIPREESPLEEESISHENMDLEEQPQEIQSLITFLQGLCCITPNLHFC
jgi:hypothetical protein